MKKIINIKTKEEVQFMASDLPMMIHGVEHSGASLFSITVAVGLHQRGEKLLIFTAYSMAQEAFIKQNGNSNGIFFLENENDISEALKFQTIFVQSGNIDLFTKIILSKDVENRIVFIKNIETIPFSVGNLHKLSGLIISGDLEINPIQHEVRNMKYNTKILFSPLTGTTVPSLEKYQAFMKTNTTEGLVSVVV